jgi:LytS/YehU family sensor histidine kinase
VLILFIIGAFIGQEFIEYLRTGELINYYLRYYDEFTWKFTFCISAYSIPAAIKFIKQYYKNTIKLIELDKLNKENQIKMLTDQLNPHFLFNTLATIRALIGQNNDDAIRVVNEMSEYFRYSLINDNKDCRTLEEEIGVVENYIEIQKIRYKSDIRVKYLVEDKSIPVLIPFLSIQTLVENAIKYGTKSNGNILEIIIKSYLLDNGLKIQVLNTGKLIGKTNREVSTKTGLSNLQKRLNILYPNNNSFDLYEQDNFVCAEISITKIKTVNENMEHNYSG